MAYRLTAVAPLLLLSHAAAKACPGSTSDLIAMVTDVAPKCFESCPEVCTPLGDLIVQYMQTEDEAAVKQEICAEPEPFQCMFAEEHLSLCMPLYTQASEFGIEVPRSLAEMDAACQAVSSNNSTVAATTTGAATADHDHDHDHHDQDHDHAHDHADGGKTTSACSGLGLSAAPLLAVVATAVAAMV